MEQLQRGDAAPTAIPSHVEGATRRSRRRRCLVPLWVILSSVVFAVCALVALGAILVLSDAAQDAEITTTVQRASHLAWHVLDAVEEQRVLRAPTLQHLLDGANRWDELRINCSTAFAIDSKLTAALLDAAVMQQQITPIEAVSTNREMQLRVTSGAANGMIAALTLKAVISEGGGSGSVTATEWVLECRSSSSSQAMRAVSWAPGMVPSESGGNASGLINEMEGLSNTRAVATAMSATGEPIVKFTMTNTSIAFGSFTFSTTATMIESASTIDAAVRSSVQLTRNESQGLDRKTTAERWVVVSEDGSRVVATSSSSSPSNWAAVNESTLHSLPQSLLTASTEYSSSVDESGRDTITAAVGLRSTAVPSRVRCLVVVDASTTTERRSTLSGVIAAVIGIGLGCAGIGSAGFLFGYLLRTDAKAGRAQAETLHVDDDDDDPNGLRVATEASWITEIDETRAVLGLMKLRIAETRGFLPPFVRSQLGAGKDIRSISKSWSDQTRRNTTHRDSGREDSASYSLTSKPSEFRTSSQGRTESTTQGNDISVDANVMSLTLHSPVRDGPTKDSNNQRLHTSTNPLHAPSDSTTSSKSLSPRCREGRKSPALRSGSGSVGSEVRLDSSQHTPRGALSRSNSPSRETPSRSRSRSVSCSMEDQQNPELVQFDNFASADSEPEVDKTIKIHTRSPSMDTEKTERTPSSGAPPPVRALATREPSAATDSSRSVSRPGIDGSISGVSEGPLQRASLVSIPCTRASFLVVSFRRTLGAAESPTNFFTRTTVAFAEEFVKIVWEQDGAVEGVRCGQLVASFNLSVPCGMHEQQASVCGMLVAAEAAKLGLGDDVSIAIDTSNAYFVLVGPPNARSRLTASIAVQASRSLSKLGFALRTKVLITERTLKSISLRSVVVDSIDIDPDWAVPMLGMGAPEVFTGRTMVYELRNGPKVDAFSPEALPWYFEALLQMCQDGNYDGAAKRWQRALASFELATERGVDVDPGVFHRVKLLLRVCEKHPIKRSKSSSNCYRRLIKIPWKLQYSQELKSSSHYGDAKRDSDHSSAGGSGSDSGTSRGFNRSGGQFNGGIRKSFSRSGGAFSGHDMDTSTAGFNASSSTAIGANDPPLAGGSYTDYNMSGTHNSYY